MKTPPTREELFNLIAGCRVLAKVLALIDEKCAEMLRRADTDVTLPAWCGEA